MRVAGFAMLALFLIVACTGSESPAPQPSPIPTPMPLVESEPSTTSITPSVEVRDDSTSGSASPSAPGPTSIPPSGVDPNPTSAASPQPSPTAAPVLTATFELSDAVGQAPLGVSFKSEFRTATEYLWNFGDGITSTNQDPVHAYTVAGTYDISLEVTRGNESVAALEAGAVTVFPGSLASIQVEPANLVLTPTDSVLLIVSGQDEFGNKVDEFTASVVIGSSAGISGGGLLVQAGTTAGSFPGAVTVSAESDNAVLTMSLDLTIEPGPLSALFVTPPEVVIPANEVFGVDALATDEYGNTIDDAQIEFSIVEQAGGRVESNLFQASTIAGISLSGIAVSASHDGLVVSSQVQVSVVPGEPASLVISPDKIEARPEEEVVFELVISDLYGNLITGVDPSVAIAPLAASFEVTGTVKALTVAGVYVEAISAQLETDNQTLEATADIEILPGTIAELFLEVDQTSIFTGDGATVTADAADRYGNSVVPDDVIWTSDIGSIDGDLFGARLTAGREPGLASISVTASDQETVVSASAPLIVDQGTCELSINRSEWKAVWWPIVTGGTLGTYLGSSVLPANFSQDWGRGEIFDGLQDNVRMQAEMDFVLQRHGPVTFRLGADDGYRLFLDGKPIITTYGLPDFISESWSNHAYQETTVTVLVQPGVHSLVMDYYEAGNLASLEFNMDADGHEWESFASCTGSYSEPPDESYTVYSGIESHIELSDRFDLDIASFDVDLLNATPIILIKKGAEHHRKIIVLQGLDSGSSLDDVDSANLGDASTFWGRSNLIIDAIQQSAIAKNLLAQNGGGSTDVIDADDILTFSWADIYVDTETGDTYTGSSHPGVASAHATYGPLDTCGGVAAGAESLRTLMDRLVDIDPEVRFDLVGHSMGGMAIAYMMATENRSDFRERVITMTALDSPLLSHPVSNPFGTCSAESQALQDIFGIGDAPVVVTIANLGFRDAAGRFLSINATLVGDTILGTRGIDVGCAGVIGFLGFGHSWVFDDPVTLGIIGDVITWPARA